MIKAGIVGVSGWAKVHTGALRELEAAGEAKLVAAVAGKDRDDREQIEELQAAGCAIFGSAEEMFGSEPGLLDACILPTSISSHVPLTLAAMQVGCDVLVEKPLTADLAALAQLEAAICAPGASRVAVGFQDMFLEETHQLKRDLLEGRIGRILETRMMGLWPRRSWYFKRNGWAGRLRDPEGMVLDSPLNNAMAHFVNLALFWCGPDEQRPAEVLSLEAELYRAQGIENFDTATVRAELDTGIRFHAAVSHSCLENSDPSLLILGEKGALFWQNEGPCEWRMHGAEPEVFPWFVTPEKILRTQRSFLGLAGPRAPVCTVAQAAAHVRFIDKLQKSAAVRDVAEEYLEVRGQGPEEQRAIRECEKAVQRASKEGALFSELGICWGTAS